jgi:S1-C subfamily serine protease
VGLAQEPGSDAVEYVRGAALATRVMSRHAASFTVVLPRQLMGNAMTGSTAALAAFSTELTDLVASCARGAVAIRLQRGRSLSGILWRSGYVVTAAEALAEASSAGVLTDDSREHPARVVGRDPSTDVALLAADGLTAAPLPPADPAALRAGQFVLALGRSAEHGVIVSFGGVAVAGGPWQSQLGGRVDRFIRLGLSLTRASEGAAVLDLDGRLVGMAVSGPRATTLAIPAATIDRVAAQLLATGRIGRGYLGMALQPVQLPDDLQKVANASVGLLVSKVDAQGGAALGGVLLGDVVVGWNGTPIHDYRQLQSLLGPESIGSTVTLSTLRGGVRRDVRLTIGERPDSG